ncbi:lasso RiPP family leader peptide-containing protein [Kibdelosporangium lantanae]|uniref:Lasso RiPP family leader peptide-containing protein n=1 Tax=Kibdelosporangium lantanae TaxID=1497396 RepID=A0ABW3M646_9PSEU
MYEPPTIHDLGPVREVTNGNADGSGDSNGQRI